MTRVRSPDRQSLRTAFGLLLFLMLAQAAAVAAGRAPPEWLRDAVIYEVFPRAFSPQGNFSGVIPQLDRLRSLGVTVLWLMPIHPVGKLKAKGTFGSPYAVRDYDRVNPEYGSAADLRRLVAAAHARDMKVFLDVVANHTAWDATLLKRHPEWYTRDAAGRILPPNPDWVDVADLDWSQPGLRQYMTGMMVRWLRDFQIDGFRCDYASGVPVDFWEAVRPALDAARPGLAMLAESDDPALLRQAFDVDYAWGFYHAMTEVLAGRKPASAVREEWLRAQASYPAGALRLRFSDNHDQLRLTGQVGLPAALAASAVMFTLDGVPLLYNGMEVGDGVESLAPSLFEHAPIQWEAGERRPHVTPFYAALTALRRSQRALTRGEVRWLANSDESRVVSFQRVLAGETLTVIVNLSSQPFLGTVDVPAGGWRELTPVAQAGDHAVASATTLPVVALPAWGFRVFGH